MTGRNSDPSPANRSAKVAGCFAWLVLLLLIGGGASWVYQEWRSRQDEPVVEKEDWRDLENRLEVALEKRRLDEAEDLVARMRAAGADPQALAEARARVEEGRAEEKGQEIAFLVLNARSALEAGRLSEAERYCSQVERLEANHPAIAGIRSRIEEGRRAARKNLMVDAIQKALAEEDWATASGQLEALREEYPGDRSVSELQTALEMAQEDLRKRRARAAELVAKARELDDGTYSEEAVLYLAEAFRLDPSESNRDLYLKMSAYGKVIEVPGDFGTITEALKTAKANDRIMVGKGVFQESLRLPEGVVLVGGSSGETVIECPAKLGAVVTVPQGVKGVRLTSLTLRHSGLVSDDERYPVVAVDGGKLEGTDLKVVRASGHGVAVVEGGQIRLRRCQITDSGWDGVAVKGEGSTAELVEVEAIKNLHHGVDFWEGASGTVRDSILNENGLNGFLSLDAAKAIEVSRTTSKGNHEVGIVVSGGVGATFEACEVRNNLLGGIFFGGGAQGIRWTGNQVEENGEAGVVLQQGVEILAEAENEVTKNEGRQIWRDAVFPDEPTEQTGAPPPAPPLEEKSGE